MSLETLDLGAVTTVTKRNNIVSGADPCGGKHI